MERRMLKIAAFRIFRTQRFQPVFKGATIATEKKGRMETVDEQCNKY